MEEARHPFFIIEHDTMLCEDATEMIEYVSQGLHDAAKEAVPALLPWNRYLPGGSDQKCR